MGNSLLDFVMALVRDPAAAARYATDPAGALADAQLTGITVTDVDNLIPVVTDSLAASTPGLGDAAHAANVWATGAAEAAFDAFDIPGFGAAPHPTHSAPPAITLESGDGPTEHAPGLPEEAPLPPLDPTPDFPSPEQPAPDFVDDAGWHHQTVGPTAEHHSGDAGFDIV